MKRITGDWHFELKAKSAFDLAVSRVVFQPGGHSGWHTHPGPVLIQVLSGVVTFYERTIRAARPSFGVRAKHIWIWASTRTSPATSPRKSPKTS